jgi:hypothetical protein
VGDFIVASNITTVQKLFAKADANKAGGGNDLAHFCYPEHRKPLPS